MLLQLQKIVSVMLMTVLVLLPLLPTQVQASSISGNPGISGFQPASQGGDAGTGSPQSTGARSGAYQTDTFTGSATYSYPIELPPYRNGLTPQLSLQYSSSNTATDSIAGYGWSLSWASIHRRQEGGIENLYNSNTFSANIFGMSGELTPYALTDSTHGEYRFSEESGPYWRLFYNVNNTWTALNQDGTTFTFGGTAISRQTDPANASHVYSWNITSIEDTNTGLVTFNYITNGNRVYPYAIAYGPVSVTLSYDTRPDPTTHYDAGFAVTTSLRLHSVTVDVNSTVSSGEYRLWTLGYDVGDNGTRSLLSTVYESGVSPEGLETELPTVDFSYTDSGTRGFSPSGATFPTTFTDPNGQDNGFRVLDVNGDGYDDLIQAYVEHYINPNAYILNDSVYINNHTPALIYDASYSFPEGFVIDAMNYSSPTVLFVIMNLVDINNDGRTDLTEGNNFQNTTQAVYLNESGTFNDTAAWPNAANLAPYTPNGTDLGRRFVDVNGDGYPDMVLSSENSSLYSTAWITETMLNNGAVENLQSSALWHAPMAFEWNSYQSAGWERGVRFADVNGDGLQDILWAWVDFHDITTLADEEWYANAVYLNNGNGGWDLAPSWTIPQAFVYSRTGAGLPPSIAANPQLNVQMPDEGGVDAGVRLMDMNADGLVDIVKGDGYWQYIESVLQSSMSLTVDYPTHEVYLNNGVNGWALSTTSNTIPTFTNGWASDTSHRYGDADADGLTDVFADATNYGGDNIYLNSATPADLLENITTTKDGEMSITYEPASADGSEMPYTSTVVAAVTTDDGFGDTHTTSYTYTGGDLVKYDTYKTEFAGFAEVTTTTESGTSVTAYDQGLTDYGKKGRMIRSQIYSGSGVLLKQYDTTWETISLGPNRNFTYASQSVQLDYEGTSSHRDTAVQYAYDLATGQVTQTQELGEVDAEPSTPTTSSTITNILPGDERTTAITYTVDTANWIVRPDVVTLAGFESEVVAKADSNYDSNGNLTSQAQWLNTNNTWMTTTYAVNSAGLPTTVTNPRGYFSTIQYDAAYTIFPTTITNALGQVSTQTYNYLTGQVTSSTDSNGRTTSSVYDGIGRLLTASVPHPTTGVPTPLTTYTYDDASFPSSVTTSSTIDSVTLESRTYMDGFGRSVQSWQANEGPGQTVTDFWYNDQGLTSQATLPYSSSAVTWTGRQSSQPSVTSLYDTLGRTVAVTSPVGTSYTSYQLWIVATTDANGHLTEYGYNGYGHMTTVDEHFGPNEYTTFYSYNALDQMHQKLDVYGNVQHTTADSLGRVVSQSTLHVPGDPGVGIWTYQYDVNGNLLQRTDPSSRTTSWTYDALDRTVNEDWYNDGTPDVVSTYDTAPNGVGRLAQVAMDGVTTSFEYDAQGNTVEETRVIGTDTYTTAWQYDLGGRVTHMTYPDNAMTVDYTYNTAGMIETIMKDGTEPIIENMDYAPTGQANVIEYGNSVVTTNTFDPIQNYRLTSTATTGTYEDNPDVDGDGLNFAQEQLYGTDPNDPDTDGDTLNDYAEVFTYGTNPTLSDTDADGFSDPVELAQGTNPLAVDTTVYNNNTSSFPVTYNTIDNVALNRPVVSLIPEDPTYSIALGYEADNLTDGNTSSLAYPAFQQFNYVIDLEGAFPLETVLLQWNEFGIGEDSNPSTPTYITSWELTGTLESGEEIVLASEDSPQANYSLVELGTFLQTLNFTQLEIHAWSTVNWIGIFELSAYTPFVDTDNDALSTYQETELYSTNPELFDTNGDGVPDSLVSRTLTLTPYSPNPTSNTTLTWNGTAEIVPINSTAAVSLVGVEYSVSGDASVPWTTATAADGAFDGNNEPYTVTVGPLLDGSFNLEVRLITSIAANNYTTNNLNNVVTVDTDADNDGVPDASDSCADTAPIAAADTVNSDGCALSQLDTDGDGLNDYEELVVYSTDPTLADTDGDTLADYDEVVVYNTNPLLQDTDSDGLSDFLEIDEFETDPNDWDTDDDTVSDGDEVNIYGTDPLEWDNFVAEDSDGDLLSDEFELANGTDPNDWDTDDNGMPDSVLGVGNILYAYSPDPTTNTDLSYTGMASLTYPFFSFAPPGMYVSGVEFQLETGSSAASPWVTASPTDGAWDSSTEDYQFNTGPLAPGTHTISTQVYVTVGSITFVAAQHSDEVTIVDEGPITYADPDDEAPWWMRLTARPAMATVTGDIQHNAYTYDAVGNITAINDTSITPTEKSVTYTYDDYYRLTSATTTGYSQGDYSVSYQYDLIGNLTYKSDVGTLTYDGTGNPTPHAVTDVNGTPYTYDTNGNLTSDGEHTYAFDIRDRMVSSGSWTFEYDHTGQRVTSTNTANGDTTQYVNSFVESRPDGLVYYIYAGGERVAQVVDGQTYYYHKDHLQGTALVTNEAGVVTFISDYTPYGGTSYNVNYGSDVAYTYGGKEFNEDIGVTYFGARYYNPTIGRFISMDPVDQPLAAPQLHNEYSYSGNSPMVFVDPSGGVNIFFSDLFPDRYSPRSLTRKIWQSGIIAETRNQYGSTDAKVVEAKITAAAVAAQIEDAKHGVAPFGSPLDSYHFKPSQNFHNYAGYDSNGKLMYKNAGGHHRGVDLAMSQGGTLPTVYATMTGTAKIFFNIQNGGYNPDGYGNYIQITDGRFRVQFSHLSSVLIQDGVVNYGDAIGIMGDTGYSFGNHLDYEIHYWATWTNDKGENVSDWVLVNPNDYGLWYDLDGNALDIPHNWTFSDV